MTLKPSLTNFKTWITIAVFLVGLVTYVVLFANLPSKVNAMESKLEEDKDNLNALAGNLNEYIIKQDARQEQEDRQEQFLMDIIDKLVVDYLE